MTLQPRTTDLPMTLSDTSDLSLTLTLLVLKLLTQHLPFNCQSLHNTDHPRYYYGQFQSNTDFAMALFLPANDPDTSIPAMPICVDGAAQDCSNSSANALELPQCWATDITLPLHNTHLSMTLPLPIPFMAALSPSRMLMKFSGVTS